LIIELCSGGELFDRIIENKYYNEEEARIIFKQIIKAIYYCHINGVCHRDLKPENFIMVSKNDPYLLKVIDFGLSRTFPNSSQTSDKLSPIDTKHPKEMDLNKSPKQRRQTKAILKTKAGTPFYIAPEVLTGNYTEKCDVWSCGVILYILFCGYPPFYGENNKEILEAVKNGKLDFSTPEWKEKSKLSIDLIKKMIVSQDLRLFADEVIKHPWMQSKNLKIDNSKLKEIWSNMVSYSKMPLLKKVIMYFIAHNLYEEDLTAMHEYYYMFDPSDQGTISEGPFKDILKNKLDIDDKTADSVFKGMDIFETKSIAYTVFIASAFSKSVLTAEKKLNIFFQISDIDKNEVLSRSDFEKFMAIQFKYRSVVTDGVKAKLLSQFAESKLVDGNFEALKTYFDNN
jgi:calcium-dependent protein kinase